MEINMDSQFSRTVGLIGEEKLKILKNSAVAVFGVGGVGSFCAEALARAGVGTLLLVDNDTINETNINRQLYALNSTVGQYKVDVAKDRILDINPSANVTVYKTFYQKDKLIDLTGLDYIVDAIDTVTSKILLVENAKKAGVKIISSMGTGNKLDPTKFQVADIKKTSVCPLARVMRRELKARGINTLKTVFSTETAITPYGMEIPEGKRQVPASISFVPSVAGLVIAGEVIKDLIL